MRFPCGLDIDDEYLTFRFVRASGPGGQNVNKLSTAVELRFDLAQCSNLTERIKIRLCKLVGRRLSREGIIVIEAQEYRSQEANRRAALARLDQLLNAALAEPRKRKATRPTKGSQTRRLAGKKIVASHKAGRGRPRLDD